MVDKPRAWEILLLLLLIGRWRRIVGQSQRQYVYTTDPYMILMNIWRERNSLNLFFLALLSFESINNE